MSVIGKRINFLGSLCTVVGYGKVQVNGVVTEAKEIVMLKHDKFKTPSITLTSVAEEMPELISRASFNYRPGDRQG